MCQKLTARICRVTPCNAQRLPRLLSARPIRSSSSAPAGCKFSVRADDAGVLRRVAIAGRPVSRAFDDGLTLEVTRVATDGTANVGSL
jgi:hypothetical protein